MKSVKAKICAKHVSRAQKPNERGSRKTRVVEILFEAFLPSDDAEAKADMPWIATNDQVVAAIKKANKELPTGSPLSSNNPANFLKDLLRKPTCNFHWPERLKALKYTARQRYGKKQVLEFLAYAEGQEVPFPDRFLPNPETENFRIESLSIPRQARALGRVDEPWLIQVAVSQRIAHMHLAIKSKLQLSDLVHLQMSVKTQPEIDAIYVCDLQKDGRDLRTLVICEAKQFGERFLEDQIREQTGCAFDSTAHLTGADRIDAILPVAMQVVQHPTDAPERRIYFMQFELIERTGFSKLYAESGLHSIQLKLESSATYELLPPVAGISYPIKTKGRGRK